MKQTEGNDSCPSSAKTTAPAEETVCDSCNGGFEHDSAYKRSAWSRTSFLTVVLPSQYSHGCQTIARTMAVNHQREHLQRVLATTLALLEEDDEDLKVVDWNWNAPPGEQLSAFELYRTQ